MCDVLLTETGYALGANDFAFQGYGPIDENNRADYMVRGLRDYWSQWPEVIGVCPYELLDPYRGWEAWDWLNRDTSHRPQFNAVTGINKTPILAQGKLVVRFRAKVGGAAGTQTSDIQVTAGSAGSLALHHTAPVQVIVPTPTPTLTPSRTPTATATLIQTPTASPTAGQTLTPTTEPSSTATEQASPTPSPEGPTATPSPTEAITPSPTVVLTDRVWLPMVLTSATESNASAIPTPAAGGSPPQSQEMVQLSLPDTPVDAQGVRAVAADGPRRRILAATGNRLLAIDAASGGVLASVALPGPAGALAVDESNGQVYAALPDSGEVLAISLTGDILARATGLGRPTRLVMGGGRLYVSDSLQQRIVMLSPSCDIMSQRTLPAAPYALALEASKGRLYVGQMGSGTILALNAETLASESSLALGGLGYPLDLALDSSGEILYVAHSLAPKYGALSVIKTGDMSLLNKLEGSPQRTLLHADSVRWDPRHNVVLLGVAEGIMAVDGRSMEVKHMQPLRRAGWPGTMALDLQTSTVFVTASGRQPLGLAKRSLAGPLDNGAGHNMTIVDEVKQRLDIVELISGYLPLQKAGRNYKGLCPFHSEKTPSFVVFPDSQSWHCFGACSTGGDIFNFVMRRENMDFPEALRILAEKAGIEIKPLDAEDLRQRDEWDRLRALNAEAAQYYHHILLESPRADAARRYMERRGVSRETWGTFQLGYAPQDWHLAEEHLRRQSYAAEDILAAGLTTEGERGNVYDRFRDRIMFPIRDIQGHVIGFGGRALGQETQPKYLNSPQTPLFDKGSVLYGINLTRESIRASGVAVIVEGYMDVVVPYQCGVTNLVACMGTALTVEQLDILKRIARRLVLALDPDVAGLRAVERGVHTAQQSLDRQIVPVPTAKGLIRYEEQLKTEIRILSLPDGLDPDELVLGDRARWDKLVEEALPVAEHFFQLAMKEADLATAKGKRQVVERLLPVLAAIDNPVERTHYLQRLAQRVRMDERQLLPELERLRGSGGDRARRPKGAPGGTRRARGEPQRPRMMYPAGRPCWAWRNAAWRSR